jgi:hypothetical protein
MRSPSQLSATGQNKRLNRIGLGGFDYKAHSATMSADNFLL